MGLSPTDKKIMLGLVLGLLVLYGLAGVWLFLTGAHAGVSPEGIVISGGDATDYVSLAHTLITNGRFALTATSAPEFFRLPGYPFFLAILFSLSSSIFIVPIVQALLNAYSVCLIYLLGKKYFSPGIGVAAAIVYALDPTTIFLSMSALSEILYVALTLSVVSLLCITPRRRIALVGAGLLMGAGLLIRPVGVYILPAFVLLAVVPWRGPRAATMSACIFLVAVIAVIAPWSARNYFLSGHVALTSQSAYNILFYNVVDFEHYRTGESEDAVKNDIEDKIGSHDPFVLRSFTFASQETKLDEEYLGNVLPQYAYFHIISTVPFFLGSSIDSRIYLLRTIGVLPPAPPTNISGLFTAGHLGQVLDSLVKDPLGLIERVFWVFVTLSAFGYSLFVLYKKRPNAVFVAFSVLLILSLALITGPIAETRYRVPAEPFLLLLAFAGVATLVKRFFFRRS